MGHRSLNEARDVVFGPYFRRGKVVVCGPHAENLRGRSMGRQYDAPNTHSPHIPRAYDQKPSLGRRIILYWASNEFSCFAFSLCCFASHLSHSKTNEFILHVSLVTALAVADSIKVRIRSSLNFHPRISVLQKPVWLVCYTDCKY